MVRRNLMHRGTRDTIMGAILFVAINSPLQYVAADIGPYPTMDFTFVMEADSTLAITEATLLQCSDETCSNSEPLTIAGLQSFTCDVSKCESIANGYALYNQLIVSFSDGMTRKSNVFEKTYFYARYQVEVRESDLLVEELTGAEPQTENYITQRPDTITLLSRLIRPFAPALLFFAGLCMLAAISIKGARGERPIISIRWIILGLWILILPLLVFGSIYSWSLPLTILIEALVVMLYAGLRKRPLLYLLTIVTLSNLVTQPVVWVICESFSSGVPSIIIVLVEILVWLIEAIIIKWALKEKLSFKESLGLSLVLNATSFGIGTLLLSPLI